MTTNRMKIKLMLAKHIESFTDELCEEDEWTEERALFNESHVEQMTNAAFAVLETMIDTQKELIKDGYIQVI